MSKLRESLLNARREMKMPPLNGVGRTGKGGCREYKYALLSDVLKCVIPPLLDNGVFLYQCIDGDVLKTVAVNSDEQMVLDARRVSLTGTSQEQGSAETYAKRYALCTAFCLMGMDDDDGQAASQASAAQQAQEPQNDVLRIAYKRMGDAIQNWCARHGDDSPERVERAKEGVRKRDEWEANKLNLEYINQITAEFNND